MNTSQIVSRSVLFMIALMLSGGTMYAQSGLKIKVISFNIRMNFADDGVNNWENRKQLVIETLKQRDADMIGMQEVTSSQYLFLKDQLSEYNSYAVGRKDGKLEDEIAAVFYKKNFEVIRDSTIWLSENPAEIGSKSWDASLYRTVSWLTVKEPVTGLEFSFYNTHFDHRGEIARVQSAKLIHKLISANSGNKPAILVGDFNVTSEQEPYKIMTASWKDCYQLKDARGLSVAPHSGGDVTYNGYKDEGGRIIDFIFVSEGISVQDHRFLNINRGDIFISDHYPVEATVLLEKKNIKKNKKGAVLD